jgi:hypothetical protein
MKTVAEVLEAHDVRVTRGRALCPAHDDNDPSMSVRDEYVYCFTCLWSADAPGLEAKLTGRFVGDVLAEWAGPDNWIPRVGRAKRPPELRHEIWLDWVEYSTGLVDMVKCLYDPPIGFGHDDIDLVLRALDPIYEAVNDVCKPRLEEDELPPVEVKRLVADAKAQMRSWASWVVGRE